VIIARDERQIRSEAFFDAETGEPYVLANDKPESDHRKEVRNGSTFAVEEEGGGYNKDTNFGKAYRIGDDEIENFIKKMHQELPPKPVLEVKYLRLHPRLGRVRLLSL
jgi:hypothetical protein